MTWPLSASLVPFPTCSHRRLYPLTSQVYTVWWYSSMISLTQAVALRRMPPPSMSPFTCLPQLTPQIQWTSSGIGSYTKPPWNLQIGLPAPLYFKISIYISHFIRHVKYLWSVSPLDQEQFKGRNHELFAVVFQSPTTCLWSVTKTLRSTWETDSPPNVHLRPFTNSFPTWTVVARLHFTIAK